MFISALVSDSPSRTTAKLNERACTCLPGWTAPFLESLTLEVERFKNFRYICKVVAHCNFKQNCHYMGQSPDFMHYVGTFSSPIFS